MRHLQRRTGYVLVFILGFLVGIAVLRLGLLYADGSGQAPLPRWWAWWLFDANPAVRLICDVMQRRDLCIGLALDGGPLERVELAWLLFAQGAPFGALSMLGLRKWYGRAHNAQGFDAR